MLGNKGRTATMKCSLGNRRYGVPAFSLMVLAALAWMSVAPAGLQAKTTASGTAKYVILLIGDGMGQPQRTSTEMYLAAKEGKAPGTVKMAMSQMSAHGIMTTHAANSIIPDSADTATAMACGVKTNSGMVGVTPDGKSVTNVAELAKKKGMKVGIVSTVSIDHATPAGFYAHQETRNNYHEIEHELASSGFDFFGGGGLKDPAGKKSKAPKGDAMEAIKSHGYKVVTNKEDFLKLKKGDGKVVAINEWLQDSEAMPYMIDRTEKDLNLNDLVGKAIELLEGPDGFFLMAEGGKVDWACHANDAVSAVNDMIDFDKAVETALTFYKKHPKDTLVLVAGDHECGGLTIGFAGTQYNNYFEVLGGQKMSFQQFTDKVVKPYQKDHADTARFEDMMPLIEKYFSLKFQGNPESDRMVLREYEIAEIRQSFDRVMAGDVEKSKDPVTYVLYGGYDPLTVTLTHVLNQKAGLGWTSYSHTGVPIIVSAEGVGAARFNGFYDNTDIAKNLKAVMGMSVQVSMALK